METAETQPPKLQKATSTPKAVLFQKFGNKAQYKTEEVPETVGNGCPGLAFPQQTKYRFRCHLELPEFSVTSDIFARKKDAEQSAAKMALEKLGTQPSTNNMTAQGKGDELVERLSYFFTDEFVSSSHPLIAHFRAAAQREGGLCGWIPVSVLPACDTKLNNFCKSINPKAESDPSLIIALVIKAAKRSSSICTSEKELWIRKRIPYSAEVMQTLINQHSESFEGIQIDAVHIPCSNEKPVGTLTINVLSNEYYMDAIARCLKVRDTSRILISSVKQAVDLDHLLNSRASYISGQNIYGDAILATIGYTRKSMENLFHENISLCTYYRMFIGRVPNGNYKLSREAILIAELPTAYTARSNWRGSWPRDLLCMFCHKHRLLEPVFSVSTITPEPPTGLLRKCQKLKLSQSPEEIDNVNGDFGDGNKEESGAEITGQGVFKCTVRILSKENNVILECFPEDSYRKQYDAIQNAALKVLTWLNKCLKQLDLPIESSFSSQYASCIYVSLENFHREFALYRIVHNPVQKSSLRKCKFLEPNCINDLSKIKLENGKISFDIEGPDSGASPTVGSLTCISFAVYLMGEHLKESLECKDEFEFEMGTGAVIHQLEMCLTQMSVNQTARFITELPSEDLILAAAVDSAKIHSLLSSQACFLEYSIKILQVTEPMEERMEQAFFSPPLSKQRLEYALRHINESDATTLIDFGCGSGSLLDSLFEHPTTLRKIVGVDISPKGLSRAAKILHSRLSANSNHTSIKAAQLYDGSITEFDSRLYGFDIGTCLEVIEHMEEDQASMFGDVVLTSFCPRILIVSTPNHEYNPILQRSALPNAEDDQEERAQALPCKFRNNDHKFEWTREQFNIWASNLASRHGYTVEFSGVGGSGDVEPGFASQIAVFRPSMEDRAAGNGDLVQPYELVWEWNDG